MLHPTPGLESLRPPELPAPAPARGSGAFDPRPARSPDLPNTERPSPGPATASGGAGSREEAVRPGPGWRSGPRGVGNLDRAEPPSGFGATLRWVEASASGRREVDFKNAPSIKLSCASRHSSQALYTHKPQVCQVLALEGERIAHSTQFWKRNVLRARPLEGEEMGLERFEEQCVSTHFPFLLHRFFQPSGCLGP